MRKFGNDYYRRDLLYVNVYVNKSTLVPIFKLKV